MKTYKFELFTSEIEENIRNGNYKPGFKLPSVRTLKEQYNTSISTIQHGYEYLMLQGLVESIPKSGYYVSNRPVRSDLVVKVKQRPVVRDAVFTNNLDQITSVKTERKLVSFNVASPDDLMIPQKLILRTMQQVIREEGAGLLRYYPSGGSLQLKETIVQRAVSYRTVINPEELLITDGALQALYIALAAVCDAGDVVAVESPCVFSVLEVIRMLRLKVIEIPVAPLTGFDVDFLRKACHTNKIKAIVVTPNFHNPTGLLLSDEQKQMLLSVAQQYNSAVIENDIYGDLNFQGKRPTTIKSFDDSGLVLSFSSYAKTLAPGIRLGWLATGKFTDRAEQIRFSLGSTVAPVYQETVNRLLSGNSYDRHLRTFRMQLAKNAYKAIHLVSDHFPVGTSISTPAGGYAIWIGIPEKTDMERFYSQCEQIGVKFTPGYTFSFSNTFSRYFRIVFSNTFSPKRIEAIQLAGQLIR